MTGQPHGPHPAAALAATEAIIAGSPFEWAQDAAKVALAAAHDPALGIDGSICKRAVIERLLDLAVEYDNAGEEMACVAIEAAANALVKDWANAR